jgi:hypothetical protein
MDPEQRLELIALLAHDNQWQSIVKVGRIILDEIYPATVFNGSSGDSGPQYVTALREALERLRELESERLSIRG